MILLYEYPEERYETSSQKLSENIPLLPTIVVIPQFPVLFADAPGSLGTASPRDGKM